VIAITVSDSRNHWQLQIRDSVAGDLPDARRGRVQSWIRSSTIRDRSPIRDAGIGLPVPSRMCQLKLKPERRVLPDPRAHPRGGRRYTDVLHKSGPTAPTMAESRRISFVASVLTGTVPAGVAIGRSMMAASRERRYASSSRAKVAFWGCTSGRFLDDSCSIANAMNTHPISSASLESVLREAAAFVAAEMAGACGPARQQRGERIRRQLTFLLSGLSDSAIPGSSLVMSVSTESAPPAAHPALQRHRHRKSATSRRR
jgi:hypothetical protein